MFKLESRNLPATLCTLTSLTTLSLTAEAAGWTVEYVATKPLPCTVLSLVNTTWNRPEATCNAAGNELPLRVASGMPTAEVPSYTCTKMASLHRRQARMQPVASVADRQGSYPHVVVALL